MLYLVLFIIYNCCIFNILGKHNFITLKLSYNGYRDIYLRKSLSLFCQNLGTIGPAVWTPISNRQTDRQKYTETPQNGVSESLVRLLRSQLTEMAEWLRLLLLNPIGFWRVGSNPTGTVTYYLDKEYGVLIGFSKWRRIT